LTEIRLTPTAASGAQPWIRLDRNELAGAFGDIGTDLPLIIGMILAAGLDRASVLIVFGMMQVFSGLRYGMPMAVQPLKAVAAIVIAQRLSGATIHGAGNWKRVVETLSLSLVQRPVGVGAREAVHHRDLARRRGVRD
jgi:hypothetical protein